MVDIIKKNEERKLVKLEKKLLVICPDCSTAYGRWHVAPECECGCDTRLEDEEEIICSEGRHYSKDCFEQMEKDGRVEKEN